MLRSNTARADASWVHGRDLNQDLLSLRDAKVIVIGCGSLGSGVARLLVQAGVGRVSLVDGDLFDWPNSGRHILGADAVDRRKASALAERLGREFPHVGIAAFDERWQEVFRRGEPLFGDADLVIAATGDWSTDAALSDLQHDEGPLKETPVVYGWLERYGHASHAVLLGNGSSCLRCGFTPLGSVRVPVARAPEATVGDGRCGVPESPHGATAVVLAQALVADLGIDALTQRATHGVHRVWIAPVARLVPGATWSEVWRTAHGDPGDGGRLVELQWPGDPECPTCATAMRR